MRADPITAPTSGARRVGPSPLRGWAGTLSHLRGAIGPHKLPGWRETTYSFSASCPRSAATITSSSALLGAVPHALGGLLHVLGGALRLALDAVGLAAGLGLLIASDPAGGFLQRPRDLVHQPGHCLS